MKHVSALKKILCSFMIFSLLNGVCVTSSKALTVGEEKKIGEQLLYQIRLAFPLLDDPDISQYINDLGDEVLTVAGVQYFDYHFNIIASSQFNAFAAPSGLVFFYSGLIEKMDHEDELVSVLAHEIGHVVARHIAKGMDQGSKVTIATTLLALASLALGAGPLSQALLTGSLAAGKAASLHFSRQHEEEADRLAYGWMKKMKRHPEGQEEMLQVMRRINRYTMGNNVPQYLLTHPYPEERLDYVQSLIAFEDKQLQNFAPTDDFAFLRIKYRIMSLVQDGKSLRNYFGSSLQSSTLDASQKVMLKYGLSQLDRRENNFDSSRKLLKEVIDFYPDKSILLVDLGLVEMEAGNKERALALLTKAYNENRHDMWATFQLARLWSKLGNLDKAEGFFIELQARMPDYSKVYFELGKLKDSKGEPGNSAFFLGKYNLYEGRLKLARHNFRMALEDTDLKAAYKKDIKGFQALIARLQEKG